MEGSSQLPSDRDLQQHMQDVSIKPSASGGTTLCRTTAPAEAPQGSEPISPTAGAAMGRYSSYKSPVELLSAPSSGKVRMCLISACSAASLAPAQGLPPCMYTACPLLVSLVCAWAKYVLKVSLCCCVRFDVAGQHCWQAAGDRGDC